jgi:hypothetical protein
MGLLNRHSRSLKYKPSEIWKWEVAAIERLEKGEGIEFECNHPWGLACYLYKNRRDIVLLCSIKPNKKKRTILVARRPIIKRWKVWET